MKLLSVKPLADSGNVKAEALVETPAGETITCRIIKQDGARAWLDTQPHKLTHKQKRVVQREAVSAWGDMISDTLDGLLLSEKVYSGSRMNRLHVQLKVFCPVCDRNTPSEFSETEKGLIRNACYFCGTLRKGRPFISRAEAEQIRDKIECLNANACQGKGETDEAEE